jgi:hypothetical protein
MNDFDFSGYEDIVKNNFYSDDFSYMSDDYVDGNGNSAGYKQIEDNFFDNPSDFEAQDFI